MKRMPDSRPSVRMLGMNIDGSLSSELKSLVIDCAERLYKETELSVSYKVKRAQFVSIWTRELQAAVLRDIAGVLLTAENEFKVNAEVDREAMMEGHTVVLRWDTEEVWIRMGRWGCFGKLCTMKVMTLSLELT